MPPRIAGSRRASCVDQRQGGCHGRNEAIFSNPSGHGHNYVLEVTVGGDLDLETGIIANLISVNGY
jgi:6-pyruvoyl-tetrahydropterin synthase